MFQDDEIARIRELFGAIKKAEHDLRTYRRMAKTHRRAGNVLLAMRASRMAADAEKRLHRLVRQWGGEQGMVEMVKTHGRGDAWLG